MFATAYSNLRQQPPLSQHIIIRNLAFHHSIRNPGCLVFGCGPSCESLAIFFSWQVLPRVLVQILYEHLTNFFWTDTALINRTMIFFCELVATAVFFPPVNIASAESFRSMEYLFKCLFAVSSSYVFGRF